MHAALLQDFVKIFPEKFQNKTNGVTPRRWLAFCNPELSALITQTLGSDAWMKELDLLQVRRPVNWQGPGSLPGPATMQQLCDETSASMDHAADAAVVCGRA